MCRKSSCLIGMSAAVGPAAGGAGAAAPAPAPFIIKQRNAVELKVSPWGEFISRIPYFSVSREGMKGNQINGFLIQLIQKQTTITLTNGRVLNTTAAISAFTNGQVNYMCDSYYEVFPVLAGETKYGDEFKNGGIGIYRPDSKMDEIEVDCNAPPKEQGAPGETYVLWDNCKNSGEIRMTGAMIFIERSIEEVRSIQHLIKSSAYGPVSILGHDFNILAESPAAGIPIRAAPPFLADLPWSAATLIHKIRVRWGTDGNSIERTRTVERRMPTAEETGVVAAGGARKNVKRTRRRRHLNRRRFRKTRTG